MKLLTFILLLFVSSFAYSDNSSMSDEEIIQVIIYKSTATHRGNCACPYNRTTNGSKCGRRSAYSRPGGYQPMCYPRDVPKELIEEFRRGG
jgi:hypothetical protein